MKRIASTVIAHTLLIFVLGSLFVGTAVVVGMPFNCPVVKVGK